MRAGPKRPCHHSLLGERREEGERKDRKEERKGGGVQLLKKAGEEAERKEGSCKNGHCDCSSGIRKRLAML